MPTFKNMVRSLRRAEAELARQLDGIRQAISSLEFGGAASPAAPRAARKRGRPVARKRRQLSEKARRAISLAQKRRWAKLRREAK
jgi:hypothetical protein